MPDNRNAWPAEPLPNPLYVVFCRVCFDPEAAMDELAAMQQVLLEAAEEAAANPGFQVCVTRPSPYGRFLGLPQAAKALDVARLIMQRAIRRGVRLAVGVAAEGRMGEVRDLDAQNVIGPTINMAARLAFHSDSPGQILVTLPVVEDARRDNASYRGCFGPPQDGQVKHTKFEYRILLPQTGILPKPPPTAQQLAATAVVYDVERFSQNDLDGQQAAFCELNRHVNEQLQAVGAADIMRHGRLWYSPAGDGGGVLFDSSRADVAWTFARLLCSACQEHVPIRIGIGTGSVAVLDGGLPVGTAVVRADLLSGYPPAGAMCVSRTFWNGRSASDKRPWETVSKDVKPEHASLLTEAWVLKPTDPQAPPTPPAQPAPPPTPAPQPRQAAPANNAMNLQQMIQDGLLSALVTAYPDQTSATLLLLAVAFPMDHIPSFQNPKQAWLTICQQIAEGAQPGAFEPLLARAALDYPHSRAFAPYAN